MVVVVDPAGRVVLGLGGCSFLGSAFAAAAAAGYGEEDDENRCASGHELIEP
jgi:hypothetical protein